MQLAGRHSAATKVTPQSVLSARVNVLRSEPLGLRGAKRQPPTQRSTTTCMAIKVPPPEVSGSGEVLHSDVQGAVTAPSAFNKNWVRLLTVTAVLVATARSSELWSVQAVKFIHLAAWATWFGTNVWTTFFAGLTMFRNMPRQLFGKVQSKLFPQYFGLAVGCIILQLGTLFYGPGSSVTNGQMLFLGSALGGSLLNWLLIEPKATDLMFARYALENAKPRNEDEIKRLYKQFSMWHGISSMVNLLVLCGAVAHGDTLARGLTLA